MSDYHSSVGIKYIYIYIYNIKNPLGIKRTDYEMKQKQTVMSWKVIIQCPQIVISVTLIWPKEIIVNS